jgi:hypothetical protein
LLVILLKLSVYSHLICLILILTLENFFCLTHTSRPCYASCYPLCETVMYITIWHMYDSYTVITLYSPFQYLPCVMLPTVGDCSIKNNITTCVCVLHIITTHSYVFYCYIHNNTYVLYVTQQHVYECYIYNNT